MKDLGVLKYFLGLEVAWNKQGFFMYQRKYALDIISKTEYLELSQQNFQWNKTIS